MLKLAQKHAGFATLTRCGGIVVVNGGQWPREAYGLRGGGLEGGLGTALEAGWRLGVGAAARFFARLCAVLGIGRGSWWMFAYASVAYRIRSSRWPADATLKAKVTRLPDRVVTLLIQQDFLRRVGRAAVVFWKNRPRVVRIGSKRHVFNDGDLSEPASNRKSQKAILKVIYKESRHLCTTIPCVMKEERGPWSFV
ncbi:uncharacterized protein L203_100055 [Cryptococcus depauperatus CBS 7841]|uniref:Uncharacterized protein n=1 Tax=Cryptococcus depauperatus CBS 7841 TaxID=1295531 RepID=A0AAJ8JMG7_9TREE